MCGIVGFTGKQQAAPILLEVLSKLEYRGYESAGLAVRDGENLAEVVKVKGRLSNLSKKFMEETLLKVLVVSDILVGLLMLSLASKMHIHTSLETVPALVRVKLSPR